MHSGYLRYVSDFLDVQSFKKTTPSNTFKTLCPYLDGVHTYFSPENWGPRVIWVSFRSEIAAAIYSNSHSRQVRASLSLCAPRSQHRGRRLGNSQVETDLYLLLTWCKQTSTGTSLSFLALLTAINYALVRRRPPHRFLPACAAGRDPASKHPPQRHPFQATTTSPST